MKDPDRNLAAESLLREALSQIEGQKRNAEVVRSRLEEELRAQTRKAAAAEKRLKQAEESLRQVREELEKERVESIELKTILDASEYRISTVERDLQARDAELAGLRESVREEREKLLAERNELESRVELLRQETVELREHHAAELSESRARAENLDRQISELCTQLETAHEEHARLRSGMERLEAVVGDLQRQLDSTKGELSELLKQHAELTETAALRAQALAEVQERERELQNSLGDRERELASERQRFEEELKAAGEERCALAEQIEILRQQVVNVQAERERSESERAHAQERSESLAAELSQIAAKQEESARELDATRERIADLEGRLLEASDREAASAREASDLDARCRALQTELEGYNQRNSDLDARLTVLGTELQRTLDERERLRAEIAGLQADRERLAADLIDSRKREAEHEETVSRLSAQCESLREEVAEGGHARTELERRYSELHGRHDEAIAQRDALSAELLRQQAEQRTLEERLEEAGREIAEAGRQLTEERQSSESLRLELDSALASARAEGTRLTSRVGELEAELSARIEENERLSKSLEGERADAVKLRQVLKLAQEEAAAAQSRHEAEAADLRGRLEKEATENHALRTALEGLRSEREALHGHLAAAEERLQRERQAFAELRELQAHTAEVCSLLESDLKTARSETGEANALLAALRAEAEGRQAELLAARERLRVAEETSGELEGKVAALDAARVELLSARDEATRKLKERDTSVTSLREERETLLSRLDALQGERDEVARRVAESETLRADLAARLAAKEAQAAAAASERESLLQEIGRLQQTRSDLEARVVTEERRAEEGWEEMGRRVAQAEAERAEIEARVSELEADLRNARQAESAMQAIVAEREAELAAATKRVTEVEAAHHQLIEEMTLLQVELVQRSREVDAWRAQLEKERAKKVPVDAAALAQLTEERDRLRSEQSELQSLLDATAGEADRLRQQLEEVHSSQRQLVGRSTEFESRAAELEAALESAGRQRSLLEQTVAELRELLGRETASVSSLKEQMESLAAGREQVERSLAEERTLRTELESQTQAAERRHAAQLTEITARYQALEAECDRLTGALGAHDITHRERAEEVVQLRLNVQSLETRLEETESERDALHEQLANVVALKDRLDRECEQLRRRVASAADLERQRAETSRLQTKLEEAERQHAEAVQRHSAAVSGYMLELNQRTDLLRQREIEQQRLHEQLTLLQQTCDDATTQVAALREEKELLELRVKELESARTVRPRLDRPAASPTAQPAVSAGAAASMTARPQAEAARSGAKRPAADRSHLPVVVLHLEENQSLRDVVRSAAQTSGVKYLTFDEAAAAGDAARPVLAANLLTRTGDPLATIAHVEKWGGEEPRALAYCADGTRGFIVGLVDFFPLPFDPDSCTARLLQVTGSLQRLLAVSDDVEAMSGLREVLSRFRCSTSMAFDGRQALDLIPMVKPDVVLVDLALPKGDALRVIGRLRCDPKMPKPPVALLWGKPVDASEFRHQLLRVIREFQFSTGELTETVREALGRLASEKSSVSGAREAG